MIALSIAVDCVDTVAEVVRREGLDAAIAPLAA